MIVGSGRPPEGYGPGFLSASQVAGMLGDPEPLTPRGMIPDDEFDALFGPCERVDPGPLVAELGSLRADLRQLERAYWSDDEGGRDE